MKNEALLKLQESYLANAEYNLKRAESHRISVDFLRFGNQCLSVALLCEIVLRLPCQSEEKKAE